MPCQSYIAPWWSANHCAAMRRWVVDIQPRSTISHFDGSCTLMRLKRTPPDLPARRGDQVGIRSVALLLAVGQLGMGLVVVRYDDDAPHLLARLLADACFAALTAWLDVFRRDDQ